LELSGESLKDIKDLVEITDYSLYFLLLAIFFGATLIFAAIILIRKYLKSKNVNHKYLALQELKNLNPDNSKEFAYKVTKLGSLFIEDAKNGHIYEELVSSLEKYKYKKISEPLKKEDIQKYRAFLEALEH